MTTNELYTVVLACGHCGPLYTSTRPLRRTEPLDPSLFRPTAAGVEMPTHGAPLECPRCHRRLLVQTLEHEEKPMQHNDAPPVDARRSDAAGVRIRTLFQTRDDEQVLTLAPMGNGMLVVTNRRIVVLEGEV